MLAQQLPRYAPNDPRSLLPQRLRVVQAAATTLLGLVPNAYQIVSTDFGLIYGAALLAGGGATDSVAVAGNPAVPVPVLVRGTGAGVVSVSFDGGSTNAMTGVTPAAGVAVPLTGKGLGLTLTWTAATIANGHTWTATCQGLTDQGPNGWSYSQLTASKQPIITVGVNGKVGLLFDGIVDFLQSTLIIAAPTAAAPFSRYTIFKPYAGAAGTNEYTSGTNSAGNANSALIYSQGGALSAMSSWGGSGPSTGQTAGNVFTRFCATWTGSTADSFRVGASAPLSGVNTGNQNCALGVIGASSGGGAPGKLEFLMSIVAPGNLDARLPSLDALMNSAAWYGQGNIVGLSSPQVFGSTVSASSTTAAKFLKLFNWLSFPGFSASAAGVAFKGYARAVTAAASAAGLIAFATLFRRVVTAAATTVIAYQRALARGVLSAAAGVPSLLRLVPRAVSGAALSAPALARRIGFARVATAIGSAGALSRQILGRAVSLTSGAVVATSRALGRAVSGSALGALLLLRSFALGRIVAVSAAALGSVARRIGITKAGVGIAAVTISRGALALLRIVAVASLAGAAGVKSLGRRALFTASASALALPARILARLVSGTTLATASIVRAVRPIVRASVATTISVARAFSLVRGAAALASMAALRAFALRVTVAASASSSSTSLLRRFVRGAVGRVVFALFKLRRVLAVSPVARVRTVVAALKVRTVIARSNNRSAMLATVDPKDPDSVEPFSFDFSPRLVEVTAGETIASFMVAIDQGDDALHVDLSALQGSLVTVWLSGGTLHLQYTVRCRVVTSLARTLDLSFLVAIESD